MSFKLNRQPIAGESYVRCNQVIIDNPLGGTPAVSFGQETIIGTAAGQVLHLPMAPLPLTFNAEGEIAVIDPVTGEPTGRAVTQAEVYALIYSAYLAAAAPAPVQVIEDAI